VRTARAQGATSDPAVETKAVVLATPGASPPMTPTVTTEAAPGGRTAALVSAGADMAPGAGPARAGCGGSGSPRAPAHGAQAWRASGLFATSASSASLYPGSNPPSTAPSPHSTPPPATSPLPPLPPRGGTGAHSLWNTPNSAGGDACQDALQSLPNVLRMRSSYNGVGSLELGALLGRGASHQPPSFAIQARSCELFSAPCYCAPGQRAALLPPQRRPACRPARQALRQAPREAQRSRAGRARR